MATPEYDQTVENKRALAKKLDAISWGLFFIWIGLAFLADVGWAVGLVGVGVIAVGTQLTRKYFGLPVERFGLMIGMVFVVWGLWELLSIPFGKGGISGSLLPILCVVLGIVLVASALLRKPRG
jgi:hypothetical protein